MGQENYVSRKDRDVPYSSLDPQGIVVSTCLLDFFEYWVFVSLKVDYVTKNLP